MISLIIWHVDSLSVDKGVLCVFWVLQRSETIARYTRLRFLIYGYSIDIDRYIIT